MAEKISAERREQFGKGAARKLRAAGRIPAVVYGHGTDPVHISLPGHETLLIVRRANQVLDIDIAGTPALALIKDVQRDPVRQVIEHVDLMVIQQGERVEVEVPVHVEGEQEPGTVATLDAQTLLLEVLATSIPQRVVVNIDGLGDGARITAADIELPEGATLVSDPELLVLGVALTAADESESDTESGSGAATADEA